MADVEKLADDVESWNIQETQCFIVHEYEADDEGRKERKFLEAVRKTLVEDGFKVILEDWMPKAGEPECMILEKILTLKHAKLILAFPEKYLCEEKLVATINKILERKLHFVTVIMYNDKFLKLPDELREFDLRRVEVDRESIKKMVEDEDGNESTVDVVAMVASDLHPFIKDEPETVDLAFLNSGTGLALSYYFGYLRFILLEDDVEDDKNEKILSFEDRIRKSKWRKDHPEIPDKNISKKMIIVFPNDCREPIEMSTNPEIKPSDRITFYENKVPVRRAGINRDYDFDFRQVSSKDGKESYYGVVYFFNIVQALTEMRDDPNKDFCNLSEERMEKEGRYCFELKLKIFLKHTLPKIPEESYELIHHPDKMGEIALTDRIFDCLKEGPTLADAPQETAEVVKEETSSPKEHSLKQTRVLCDIEFSHSQEMPDDVKTFVCGELKHEECKPGTPEVDYHFKLIEESSKEKSSRMFMVLTDEFVRADCFEFVFYHVLHQVFEQQDRRFLVVLDCLKDVKLKSHPMVLELRVFFSHVSHTDPSWKNKVKRELEGAPLPVTSDLKFLNMGTGLALSWYYRYLKIRMPKMVDLFKKCPFLMEKLKAGRMSYKAFVLQPHSCCIPNSVSDFDPTIEQVMDIKIPRIKKATRYYTPTLYRIKDEDGSEYYAFLEFNTQANTMYKIYHAGLMTESVMLTEWERFFNKLKTLICHKNEPMQLRERMKTIEYDDKKMKSESGALSKWLLRYIKDEIEKEGGKLLQSIENGAEVQ